MQKINKLTNKVVPMMLSLARWIVRTVFEIIKLAGLAYMVLNLIEAVTVIEYAVTGIVVFAAIIATKK